MTAPRPYALLAEVTYRCPLHCPYCSNPLQQGSGSERDNRRERWIADQAAVGSRSACGFRHRGRHSEQDHRRQHERHHSENDERRPPPGGLGEDHRGGQPDHGRSRSAGGDDREALAEMAG